ncbi:MAG TPA: 23S rRNA (adenine(2030)-N(6))-methyltransferase RlmJ [Hyphomonadaceae bacterium]|nr:23S rRNA (adenine(2030)-N(6))-methyltransferase RlmJ [Hyphomonadaceae bacterium]
MNYRHAYHAGNFADVLKHACLIVSLSQILQKPAAAFFLDTHAGRGRYDLTGEEAQRAQEWRGGVGRVLGGGDVNPALSGYAEAVRGDLAADAYPGSPLLLARFARPVDRVIAYEAHPEEFAPLQAHLASFAQARAVQGDGFTALKALLPPPERRGLVLIDPPFEANDERQRLCRAMEAALRRWETGQYLIWLPIKSYDETRAVYDALAAMTGRPIISLELQIGRARSDGRLNACCMIAINPAFALAQAAPRLVVVCAAQMADNVGPMGRVVTIR